MELTFYSLRLMSSTALSAFHSTHHGGANARIHHEDYEDHKKTRFTGGKAFDIV
jgi:hypothetical protein